MNISAEELKSNENTTYEEGYRVVYFYEDGHYYVGAYCETIEGFMIEFAENDPIIDEDDIPQFISVDDLLERYLNSLLDISEVALYKTDGTCVEKKVRVKE